MRSWLALTVPAMTVSAFEYDGRNLVALDVEFTVGVRGPRVGGIAAVDTVTGAQWVLSASGLGWIPRDELQRLSEGLSRHTVGGFTPESHSAALRAVFDAQGLVVGWDRLADVRQLTAGALGIPPTHAPTIGQTCRLWGVPEPVDSCASRAMAAADCFDALSHRALRRQTVRADF